MNLLPLTVALVALAAASAFAAGEEIDPDKLTCAEFTQMSPEAMQRASAAVDAAMMSEGRTEAEIQELQTAAAAMTDADKAVQEAESLKALMMHCEGMDDMPLIEVMKPKM
jgi:HdeA/HdeB family